MAMGWKTSPSTIINLLNLGIVRISPFSKNISAFEPGFLIASARFMATSISLLFRSVLACISPIFSSSIIISLLTLRLKLSIAIFLINLAL